LPYGDSAKRETAVQSTSQSSSFHFRTGFLNSDCGSNVGILNLTCILHILHTMKIENDRIRNENQRIAKLCSRMFPFSKRNSKTLHIKRSRIDNREKSYKWNASWGIACQKEEYGLLVFSIKYCFEEAQFPGDKSVAAMVPKVKTLHIRTT